MLPRRSAVGFSAIRWPDPGCGVRPRVPSRIGTEVRLALVSMSEKKRRAPVQTTVLRKEWLTPGMVRVTLGGPGLDAYEHNDFTDRYVKVLFDDNGTERRRAYTVRRYDSRAGELDIDFVVHGDRGLAGPWAAACQPGDPLAFIGPGGAYAPAPDAAWHLLVGDESALPAIASSLETMPAGAQAYVFVEVADTGEQLDLVTDAKAEIRWFHRDSSAEPPGEELVRAVQSLDFPDGEPQVFVHGEAGIFRALRRYLGVVRGLDVKAMSISGYWRRGLVDEDWRAEKARIVAEAEREARTGY